VTRADASRKYYENFDQQRAIKGYKELAKKNVAVCPTLIGSKQLAYLDEDDHPKRRLSPISYQTLQVKLCMEVKQAGK
jgi:hypothetical protein